jgi:hypothetical protein
MKLAKFSEIVKEVLIPIIEEAAKRADDPIAFKIENELKKILTDFKKDFYKKYQKMRNSFRKNDFIKKNNSTKKKLSPRISRHKVAALIYIAFIKVLKDNNFFGTKNKKMKCLFAHNIAFNLGIAIVENFICTKRDGKDVKYRAYIKEYGIVLQIKEYVNNIIKQLLENSEYEPSFFLLASMFYSIECSSRKEFENNKEIYV